MSRPAARQVSCLPNAVFCLPAHLHLLSRSTNPPRYQHHDAEPILRIMYIMLNIMWHRLNRLCLKVLGVEPLLPCPLTRHPVCRPLIERHDFQSPVQQAAAVCLQFVPPHRRRQRANSQSELRQSVPLGIFFVGHSQWPRRTHDGFGVRTGTPEGGAQACK